MQVNDMCSSCEEPSLKEDNQMKKTMCSQGTCLESVTLTKKGTTSVQEDSAAKQ